MRAAHYNYFRDFDPSAGRYIESDPIGLFVGTNTYAYASSQPLGAVDPRGLASFPLPGFDPGRVSCAMSPDPGACMPSWAPPSCFWSCMADKAFGFGVRATARKGIELFGPEPLAGLARGVGAFSRGVAPYIGPIIGLMWEGRCIKKCDTCRDSGNANFSYP